MKTPFLCAALLAVAGTSHAFTINLSTSDFASVTPFYSFVTDFSISIDIDEPLVAGGTYSDPMLNVVDYEIMGELEVGTPSGFPGFALERTIIGDDYYTQGSSLDFTISGTADLSDGLQLSEITGVDPVFVFNAREVGTGRYHPMLFQLNADGTGSVRNSNNMGGINPGSGLEVDVNFGEEYITDLTFDPAALTLAVPEPSRVLMLLLGAFGVVVRRRR
jgi:hypothetical protein